MDDYGVELRRVASSRSSFFLRVFGVVSLVGVVVLVTFGVTFALTGGWAWLWVPPTFIWAFVLTLISLDSFSLANIASQEAERRQ